MNHIHIKHQGFFCPCAGEGGMAAMQEHMRPAHSQPCLKCGHVLKTKRNLRMHVA